MLKRLVNGFLGDRVDEDLDECYPLRSDVDVPLASKFRPRKNKRLSREKWEAAFDADGRLVGLDSVLESVRRGGVDPHIRPEVWEFLLGVFEPTSTAAERAALRRARRELYSNLKSECNLVDPVVGSGVVVDFPRIREDGSDIPVPAHAGNNALLESLDMSGSLDGDGASLASSVHSMLRHSAHFVSISPLDGSTAPGVGRTFTETRQAALERAGEEKVTKWRLGLHQIGVDVMRADRTLQFFEDEGNRARLMDVLAMYSWFDSDVGYCQGMGDLMSPMIVLFDSNADAFWCFERLMRKVRIDFIGTASSLGVQAEINKMAEALKWMQPELYIHLESIGAGSLFFTVRAIMTMFRRELSFADALYLWEMEFAWEYDFQEVARMAERDRAALQSLVRDPFKGSGRDTYLESEDEYAIRKEIERAKALNAERETACDARDTPAHVTSSLPVGGAREAAEEEGPGTSSLPHSFPEKDSDGQEGGDGEGSGDEYDLCMVSGPLTAGEHAAVLRHREEKQQQRQTGEANAAATSGEGGTEGLQGRGSKLSRDDSLRSNGTGSGRPSERDGPGQARGERVPGSKSFRPPKRYGATTRSLTKEALSKALSDYRRRPSNRRPAPKLAEASKRASIKATFRRLRGSEAQAPPGEAQGQAKAGGRTKELGRRSSVKKGPPPRMESAGWQGAMALAAEVEAQSNALTADDLSRVHEDPGSQKLSRLSTFCVLAVLCHARNDLLTCDGMDDVVDVFNEHATGWEVKELVKAAHEHQREYEEKMM